MKAVDEALLPETAARRLNSKGAGAALTRKPDDF